MKKHIPLLITFLIGAVLWFSPKPDAISTEGWHILAIFTATIFGIILRPLPMGAIAIIALGIVTITGTLTVDEALSSYSRGPIWLIVIAFFISRGFMKTRLGTRIGYYFVRAFGRNSLSLSYSLVASELLLAPAIPSVTARAGGVLLPIVNALSIALGSKPNDPSRKKIGTFLILTCFHGSVITSAMFLTAMAANPIIAILAGQAGVEITWGGWALAAIAPGIVSLIAIPLLIYIICPPQIKHIPHAKSLAHDKLQEMGRMSRDEFVMLGVFICLVLLWSFGNALGVNALTTALLGVSVLLITGVLDFGELMQERAAWGTFVWFGALLSMATYLKNFGVIGVLSDNMSSLVSTLDWPIALGLLGLVYFYSHYFFASSMAHVGAMYTAFLSSAILLGTPPFLAAILLAFFSNLYGGLTHYGIGSAPVLYGSGFADVKTWWRVGFIVSVANIIIWSTVGVFWWKFLGLF